MKKLFAYLPCYNEAGNIQALVEEWLAQEPRLREEGYALEIVPIDDASTDGTLDILRRLDDAHPQLRHLAHPQNKNLGGVLMTAVGDFLAQAGPEDLLCFMDADNTHKPRFVHAMLDALSGGAGCVIASRYQPGAKVTGLAKSRELFSAFARVYYTLVLHVPGVKDYTCGYRLYTRAALAAGVAAYGDRLVENRSFACMMELLYKLHLSGCAFAEVPFTLYYGEKEGASKMDLKKTIHDSLTVALRLRRRARQTKRQGENTPC